MAEICSELCLLSVAPLSFPSKPWHVLTPYCFSLPPLFSWQLWAPTISSHTAYHLLHFTDCGCLKAKFTAQPHKPRKPTPLFRSFAFRSSTFFFPLLFLHIFWGCSKELWVFRIVTAYAMKWCWLSCRLQLSKQKVSQCFKSFLSAQLLLLNISVKDVCS